MTTLQKLCDEELIKKTKCLVADERMKTLEVIEYLQVIYNRRLHLKRGFSSLHEFLVKELSYSDGAAHRRISAMRLMQDVPEAKNSIANGKLSLSTASTVQVFFRSEKQNHQKIYSQEEKLNVLSKVARATKQDCEKALAKISPTYAATKKNEMRIQHDAELAKLMEEYQQAAMLSDGSVPAVLKSALKTAIESVRSKKQKSLLRKVESTKHSRYISLSTKQAVWTKHEGQCSYVDLKTKNRCGARHRLHFDHILPFALDGGSTLDNLRLLCQAHNALLAIQTYGEKKMLASRKKHHLVRD